ncbi:MAG: aminotransferase class I/II-fold pyridoxal phosphate-dependent enzyme [Burkholderiaceae bacterium]
MHGHHSLVQAALRAHEAVMFCIPTAIQVGFARFLQDLCYVEECLREQRVLYRTRRNAFVNGLQRLGFVTGRAPAGAYFITASAHGLGHLGESDVSFAQRLMQEASVATLPISALCAPSSRVSQRVQREWSQMRWLRFAFCKSEDVIDAALQNLSKWRSIEAPES